MSELNPGPRLAISPDGRASGVTPGGIVFPLAGIDEFDPATDMQLLAESTEHVINGLGTVGWAANTLMRRDSNGRSQVNGPAAATDVVNKDYADHVGATAQAVLNGWLRPVLYQAGPANTLDGNANNRFLRCVSISTSAAAGLYFVISRIQCRAIGDSQLSVFLSARSGAEITDQNTAQNTMISPGHWWVPATHGQFNTTTFGLISHSGGNLAILAAIRGEGSAFHADAGSSYLVAIRLGNN